MNISGHVLFDLNGLQADAAKKIPLTNIPVVLQIEQTPNTACQSTGMGAAVLTDCNGAFCFTNVPAGSYRLIEAWGYPGETFFSTVDYLAAQTIITVTPNDPEPCAVPLPPGEAAQVVSLSPNIVSLPNLTTDQSGLLFLDGPGYVQPSAPDCVCLPPDIPVPDLSNDFAHVRTKLNFCVGPNCLLPLQNNVVAQGNACCHQEGISHMILSPGCYLLNYRSTAFHGWRYQNRNIQIELLLNGQIYPGGTANAMTPGMTAINLTGTAIISNSGPNAAVSLVNASGMMVHFYNTSITLVKLC